MSVGQAYKGDQRGVHIGRMRFGTHALNSEANLGRAVATMV